MAAVSLKIHIVKSNNVKTMQFEESMIIYDVCRLIRERVPDAAQGQPNEYGLFRPDEDPTKGRWLEQGRTLEYYHLKDGDMLEYRKKQRVLRVKMLDGTIKTVLVDDSQTVAEITKTVCARIGLSNPEEFSFITEEETSEMTLRRNQHTRNQKEMERLKKTLHTDDTLNWLNKDKSLREQGIDETQVLTLRKKLFFSDQNVDCNDPVQLNLLFVQSRDGIVNNIHPCTKEEAIQFAALQCQVQFGNHNDAKHKPGFLNLGEFVPHEYVRIKGVEKAIFAEHRKFHNLSEIHAKFRYIQLCRSLRTYGVTFFLVKEKMRGRNKLVPRLLGITRESVMRVDETTKEVLKTWPLTTVRRWAASPNSFTLDFGDYSESFYSVQTTEGETISQLIAAYIDIIMKKTNPHHMDLQDDEEEPVIMEVDIDAKKATTTTYHPSNVGHAGMSSMAMQGKMGEAQEGGAGMQMGGAHAQHGMMMGAGGVRHGALSEAQNPQLMMAQQNLADHIRGGLETVSCVTGDLYSAAEIPVLGEDSASQRWKQTTLDVSRQNVSSAMAAMLASAASVITQTGVEPEEINYTAVGSAVTTISTNLTELAKAVRMLAALSSNDSDSNGLLDAARALAAATANLLNAAQPESLENRPQLQTAAGEMGTTGGQLLMLAGDAEVDIRTQEALVTMAKAVASATAALVTNARNVAAKCDDQALQNQVIVAAKQTALATQALIACTKVLAPCIDSPLCQEQLIEACKLVAAAVEKIVLAAQAACGDDDALRDLGAAATAVTEALNSLIEQIKEGVQMSNFSQYDEACEAILVATDQLFGAMGNAQEMVKQAKILAEATSALVNAIKLEAEAETDPDARRRLLDAAKSLADATSRMVEAAKMAAKNPNDHAAQEALRLAAENLRAATNAAASSALKKKAIKKLELAAKQTAAVSTQLIAAAQGAGASNRNDASQSQLMAYCKSVAEQISNLVQAVRSSMTSQDNPSAQLGLINSSQAMIPPAGKMVAAAKAAVPTVGDQAAALQLGNFAKATAASLAELRAATVKASEVCGSLEVDSAMDVIRGLAKELAEAKRDAQERKLLPLPGQTIETCSMELGATSKTVGSSMAQLLTAANQGNENYTGIAARDTANALRVLASAVRGVAAYTKSPQTQEYIIVTAQQVMEQSVALISEAKQVVQDPNTPNKQMRLAQAAKAVSQALNRVVNCLPGIIEYDQAIKVIAQASLGLQSGKFPPATGQTFQMLQSNLSTNAAALNVASSEVVTSARSTPDQQAVTTTNFSGNFEELLRAGMTLAGATKDRQSRDDMIGTLRNVSMSSSNLLLAAKGLSVDPNAPNVQNRLAAAARSVTDSINALLNLCSSAGPGQRECDNALRNIEAVAPVLDNPNEPVNELSYFDCLDVVAEKAMVLGEAGSQITAHAKKGQFDEFGVAVGKTSQAVCQITEAAAQAAYLIGVADPSSVAAVPGLVDQTKFARAHQAISAACQTLLSPSSTQEQVLAAATIIAKHTSTLCHACKQASSKTSNPVAKKHFMQAAKDVASATAALVKNIKVLAANVTPENRTACAHTTKPLTEAVDALVTFVSSPQFASTPAKISAQARQAQEPIIRAGHNVNKSSSSLLASAKSLAVDPKDASMWQLLAAHSKAVTDSVKSLILSIREKCPGQKECDSAIDTINETVNQLDQAVLAAMNQSLAPNASTSLQGFQEQMLQCVGDIKNGVGPMAIAAKGEAENLGHQVLAVANMFPGLAGAAIGAASRTTSSQLQNSLLEQTKTLAESALQFMYGAKEAGGNPKSVAAHPKVDEAARMMATAAEELTALLEKAGAEAGLITGMIDDITKAQAMINEMPDGEVEKSFTDYQAETFAHCKSIVKHAQSMVAKVKDTPTEIVTSSRELTVAYSQLVQATQGALATIESDEVATQLQKRVHVVGDECMEMVRDGAELQSAPDDQSLRRALTDQCRVVAEKVSHVLSAVQSGAIGSQACNEAVSSIRGLVGDIETTSMFASAGALNPDGQIGVFAEHRDKILETAKKLVDDTKRLVSSAAASQEQLAAAAKQAVKTITSEVEHVKLGASALSSDDTGAQLLLLNAVKDVANSLGDLINCTRVASGKSVQDPAMDALKTSAKAMVTQVGSLLKTVKNVEDDATRGTHSLESCIEGIDLELKEYNSSSPPRQENTPQDLITATKGITLASAKTVSAGNSCKQAEVAAAANLSRKSVTHLLQTCKGVSLKGEGPEHKERILQVGRECGLAYRTLLELVHQTVLKPTAEQKARLPTFSKEVASAVADVVRVAEEMRADWVNPLDPHVIAENELLQAAASIEAAAKKLSELQPRKSAVADDSLNFEEQILEAARNIANATSALVKSATAAQRELVAQGKLRDKGPSSEDTQWSDGLVSAAKLVATATSNLCDSANMVVQGNADEDKLIAAAKAVAAHTAQLLLACQVKADPRSENNRRLQVAGVAVKKATEALVKAAEESIVNVPFGTDVQLPKSANKGFMVELEKQEEIARKMRELETLQSQLKKIRIARAPRH